MIKKDRGQEIIYVDLINVNDDPINSEEIDEDAIEINKYINP